MVSPLIALLRRHQHEFHAVVSFDPSFDRIAPVNLALNGSELPMKLAEDLDEFDEFMENLRMGKSARYLVGGYGELRDLYGRSELFNEPGEPRRLHLGTDVWGPAGTPVFAFLGGMVHSVGFNNRLGDYGATLIVLHQLEGIPFYSLYGHISLRDIQQLAAGQYISRGQEIAHFGLATENGYWPPHLHLQLINEIGMFEGDYPGVCRYSERERWLLNCPDPEFILRMNQYLISV